MGTYALVRDGIVINTIIWDGENFDFDKGVEQIEVLEGISVSPGYFYNNGTFSAPPLTEEQIEEQRLQAIALNMTIKSESMAQATAAIAPLQDAIDLDEATDEEAHLFKLWKQYRVALNRIDANTAEPVNWPETPSLAAK